MRVLDVWWKKAVTLLVPTALAITLSLGLLVFPTQIAAQPQDDRALAPLELVRATRPWEFVSALGTRSALLGDESGNLEAWVYPLKIFRNFHLRFKVGDEIIEGKALARSTQVRPESTTITYAWDTFSVKETLFAPTHEAGAVIALEIDTSQQLEVEAVFERDFELEWPGTMGGSDIDWNPTLHAFSMDEVQHRFTALVGSPSATTGHVAFYSNYANARENVFGLGSIKSGKATKLIVISASFQGLPGAESTYKRLVDSFPQLLAASSAYYKDYLNTHVRLTLPDPKLQEAYEWAQVSVLQGLVTNPYLGTGLVAGFKVSSEEDQRPGYAWFFGRDALWTSLALNAEGDFANTRTALTFLAKYQRSDGKITHEIAQGASFVPWFDAMPYAYAAADATPLFVVAMDDYVRRSGDLAFAQEKWDNLLRAYQFLVSTYDKDGLPLNEGVGHGWVEGGPLLPVKTELYQAAVSLEALRSLSDLAHVLGKEEQSRTLSAAFDRGERLINHSFWIEGAGRYAFGLDERDKKLDIPSVLASVPMWFGLLDEDKARSMIDQLDSPEIETSWGMRIIPADNPKYESAGYHSGTVWPLFTGWASVGDYRYHKALSGYANLQTNALLTFDGSLGHIAEVLSGSYYQTLASGSPHQVWSSAMVISPLLTGLLGLHMDALANHLEFSPHIPSDWTSFAVDHVRAGACMLNFHYDKLFDERAVETITLQIERTSGDTCVLEFSPALSRRAHVVSAKVNGHSVPFHSNDLGLDQHVTIAFDLRNRVKPGASKSSDSKHTSVVIKVKDDFGLFQHFALPALGSANNGLRVVSEKWSDDKDTLKIQTASAASGTYQLGVWNVDQIERVDGAELVRDTANRGTLNIGTSLGADGRDSYRSVVLHFAAIGHIKVNKNSDSAKGEPNAN